MLWAYVLEVSGEEERENAPIFQLINELEIADDKCFFDLSGSADRKELKILLEQVAEGDSLIVRSVVDLADTPNDLLSTLSVLSEKKVALCSYMESYLCGENYLEQIVGIFGVYQELAKKKQVKAYQRAVAEGKVGRPSNKEKIQKALTLFGEGKIGIAQAQALTGLSRSSIYRYIKNK